MKGEFCVYCYGVGTGCKECNESIRDNGKKSVATGTEVVYIDYTEVCPLLKEIKQRKESRS